MRRMQTLKELIALVLRLTMLPLIIREVFQRNRVTIIVYHRISAGVFEKHMRYLLKHYNVIPLHQFIEAKYSHGLKQLPKKAAVVTFDDGAKITYSLKEVIQKYNIPVTMFVCSDFLGTRRRFWFNYADKMTTKLKKITDAQRLKQLSLLDFDERRDYDSPDSMSLEEVSDLAKIGISIQSHSATHPILPMCDNDKARNEIVKSKKDIEDTLGNNVYCFAYPNGDYCAREIDICQQSGYMAALTMDPGFNNAGTDVYRLKRLGIDEYASVNRFAVKISGVWNMAKVFVLDKRWIKPSYCSYCKVNDHESKPVANIAKNTFNTYSGSGQKSPMNILFYFTAKPGKSKRAGWETHIHEVLGNMCRMGHTIRYVDGSMYSYESEEEEDDGSPDQEIQKVSLWTRFVNLTAASPVKGEAWLFWNLLKETRSFLLAMITVIRQRPDVIYRRQSHFNSDYFISKIFRIPVVKEVNSLGSGELSISGRVDWFTLWLYRRIERYTLPRADKIIVVTKELKELLQSEYGIESDKIVVVYNGANIDIFKPIDTYYARAKLRLSTKYKYICFVGNLAPWQGLDCLIQSVPPILEGCSEARFLVVGDGFMRAELMDLAKEVGVLDKVIFTGSVPYEKVPFYINSSEICVAPFVLERNDKIGLSPLKLYEYLACGKPVVASDIAGVYETLEAADAGITVAPEDPDKLAEAVLNLLNNDELRKQMSENGRNYVVANHSWQKVSERVADILYSSMFQKKGQSLRRDEPQSLTRE